MAIPPLRGRRRIAAACAAVLAGSCLAAPPSADAAPAGSDVARMVQEMTLREKIGQLFVTYAYGDTATTEDSGYVAQNQALYGVDNGAQLVDKFHLGGVIYFTWSGNLNDPTQIAGLSNGLQRAATQSGAKVPLLISTDQEGGNVVRIGAPVAVSPGNMALGASFEPALARRMYSVTGHQLAALGVNVDDAPVVDTNTNPANTADGPRAFSDDPGMTSTFAAAAVRGLQSAGVAATAKHFPGLGGTTVNTDNGVAVTDESRSDFNRYDLPAFRAAIAAGTEEIMAAHIIAPALDRSGRPASLSRRMVTGLLRNTLGYHGLVITDALSAAALGDYTDAQRAVLAVQAGDDQLLMPTDLAASIQAVVDAVRSGVISTRRIDQSVTRILTLKKKLGLFADNQVDVGAAASAVGTSRQNAVMESAAAHGITLYRNTQGTLPLTGDPARKILVTGYGLTTGATLTADIAATGVQVRRVYTGSDPDQDAIDAAVSAAKPVDDVVVVTDNAWAYPGQRALVRQLSATGTPTIVLAVGAPYELGYQPATPTFLASYGYQPASLQQATDVLFGARPLGRSPITIRSRNGARLVAALGSGETY